VTIPLPPIRAKMQLLMYETLADEQSRGDWTYEAVRPMPVPPPPWHPGQHVRGDCSKGVQYICRWSPGAPDPMMNDWGPYGNSQTLWIKLHHVDAPEELEVGDIITFGVDGEDHATMVLQDGADPLLWSFGRQGAPNKYNLSQDPRPRQFLTLHIVEPPPTPQDKLRAMTGFYSWTAWRLGEGPWRKYGERNPVVRPNVPRRIPLDWWKRYAQFLANRKKPL